MTRESEPTKQIRRRFVLKWNGPAWYKIATALLSSCLVIWFNIVIYRDPQSVQLVRVGFTISSLVLALTCFIASLFDWTSKAEREKWLETLLFLQMGHGLNFVYSTIEMKEVLKGPTTLLFKVSFWFFYILSCIPVTILAIGVAFVVFSLLFLIGTLIVKAGQRLMKLVTIEVQEEIVMV